MLLQLLRKKLMNESATIFMTYFHSSCQFVHAHKILTSEYL